MSEGDKQAGEVEEGSIHGDLMIMANQQTAKVSQPGKGAFDFPTVAVAPERASVVERGFAPSAALRADEQDAFVQKPPAQGIAVVGTVGNHPQRPFLRTSRAAPRCAPKCFQLMNPLLELT